MIISKAKEIIKQRHIKNGVVLNGFLFEMEIVDFVQNIKVENSVITPAWVGLCQIHCAGVAHIDIRDIKEQSVLYGHLGNSPPIREFKIFLVDFNDPYPLFDSTTKELELDYLSSLIEDNKEIKQENFFKQVCLKIIF